MSRVCDLGICLYCQKSTARHCSSCNSKQLTDQYTEVYLPLSDSSLMKVGVCLGCKDKIFLASPEEKVDMMEAVKTAEDQQMTERKMPKERRKAHPLFSKRVEIA
jgi:hypothetical protein